MSFPDTVWSYYSLTPRSSVVPTLWSLWSGLPLTPLPVPFSMRMDRFLGSGYFWRPPLSSPRPVTLLGRLLHTMSQALPWGLSPVHWGLEYEHFMFETLVPVTVDEPGLGTRAFIIPPLVCSLSSPELYLAFGVQIGFLFLLKELHELSSQNDSSPHRLVPWPFCPMLFIFPRLNYNLLEYRGTFYPPLCILQLPGNQLIFHNCLDVKDMQSNNPVKVYRYFHLCNVSYPQEKKGSCLSIGSGIDTYNQLCFLNI